jgi:hypothetical protein
MSALMIWMVVLLLLSVADKSMATGSIRRLVLAAGANMAVSIAIYCALR